MTVHSSKVLPDILFESFFTYEFNIFWYRPIVYYVV